MHRQRRAIISLVTVLLTTGCASLTTLKIQPPEVSLVNIAPLSATLFEQRLRVDLRVRNPNDFNIAIGGLDFQLTVNDSELARGVSNDAVTLPHLGETLVSVAVTTTPLTWLRQLRTIAALQEIRYDLAGHIHLSRAGRLPFRRSGRFFPADLLNPSAAPETPPRGGSP